MMRSSVKMVLFKMKREALGKSKHIWYGKPSWKSERRMNNAEQKIS